MYSAYLFDLILLNGRPYYLRLVLEQGYWPESHMAERESEAEP